MNQTPSLLSDQELDEHGSRFSEWTLSENRKEISRSFSFENYYQTMAFVNAVAWIAHQQDHHPDMVVNYNTCDVTYSTHSAGGLTEKDFQAAKAVDALQE